MAIRQVRLILGLAVLTGGMVASQILPMLAPDATGAAAEDQPAPEQVSIAGVTPTPTATLAKGNDDFDAAVVVSGLLPYSNKQETGPATLQVGEPQPCALIGGTVWYAYTPSTDVLLTADTLGSNYDTAIAAYTGSSLGALSLVACDDDGGPDLLSEISFVASAGTTYRFQVGGFNGSTGNQVFNIDAQPTPTPTPQPSGPAMSIAIDPATTEECSFAPPGSICVNAVGTFDVLVSADVIPITGYVLAQAWIDFDSSGIVWSSSTTVWPDCDVATDIGGVSGNAALQACLTGITPPQPPSYYQGILFRMSLSCNGLASNSVLKLIPFGTPPANNNGALYVDGDSVPWIPNVGDDLSVTCEHQVPPTPPAAPTCFNTGLGDANGDGAANVIDAMFVFQFVAGLRPSLACPDNADVDGNAVVNSIDGSLILQFAAGLISL